MRKRKEYPNEMPGINNWAGRCITTRLDMATWYWMEIQKPIWKLWLNTSLWI